MNKKLLFNAICILAIGALTTSVAHAFPASKYANTSKLASGKWVRIEIPEDGIYQLTYIELAKMGFIDPNKVRIYGFGGHPISEILNGEATDDLVQVPYKDFGNKICFYGCGPVRYSLDTPTTTPHFTRKINSYSQAGYYFITYDDGSPKLEPQNVSYGITGRNIRRTSLDYFHHEKEIVSASQSGKDMLGEAFIGNSLEIQYNIPNLYTDSSIVVNTCVAVKSEKNSNVEAKLNAINIPFSASSSKVLGAPSEYTFYNTASPYARLQTDNQPIPTEGTLSLNINSSSGNINWARLDYFILTYYHLNSLKNTSNSQVRMNFTNVSSADIITITDDNPSIQLWNIDNPHEPKNYTLSKINDITGFTPLYSTNQMHLIAFDPNKPLKSIAGYSKVTNQNIHGLPTPDMVIVTCEELLPQADRIAQIHRDNDNMIVHVLDQQKIFNEFSSGTPDAMGIRLMNKMFYDRNKTKFKYLLMFGAGSQDNRQIMAKRPCTILTYETDGSNDEYNSYVSDDFFGMLDDDSGENPASELLRLGVGRIPCASLEEAKGDVDKLVNYINHPDYGPWRNNALFVADFVPRDSDIHSIQAEGIANAIVDDLGVLLNKNKVFITQFPNDPISGYAYEARKRFNSLLESGQYFMTYIGHANGTSLTKDAMLWTTNESKKATYPHPPIMTTACCDVARYDGTERGLMEIMFHQPEGGAIAMLTATRSAYASGNDALNQAFTRALFSYNNKGYMPTLGEAYKLSKQSFGKTTNYNKMMFVLLGDPAMKCNYPKPYFKITKINGYAVGTSNISSGQLQQITIEAKVYTPNGSGVDTTFNGNATLAIYDYLKKEFSRKNSDVYFPRNLLTQVEGRVVNGIFTGNAIIPRYTLNPGATGAVSVYAHRENSDEMVNGYFDKLLIRPYDESNNLTIQDNTPPVINAIYCDDENDFAASNSVGTKSILHIKASDDYGFNNQLLAIGNGIDIKLDEGKTSLPEVTNFVSMSDGGKTLEIEYPMELLQGYHTLKFTAHDMAGNRATRVIEFFVREQQATLTVRQEPATNVATFDIATTQDTNPEVKIMVFNSAGKYVWYTTTRNFPYDWNLKTRKGKRLPAGVYKYYGKYIDGDIHGGTNVGTLIIADEHKKH